MEKCIVRIGGREWELKPLYGLQAIRMMPKVIKVLSTIAYSVINAGVPLDRWISSGEGDGVTVSDLLKLFAYVSSALGENISVLTDEIMPFLLQTDKEFLDNNGTADEIIVAFWNACKFHYNTSFGEEVTAAIKKFLRGETQE